MGVQARRRWSRASSTREEFMAEIARDDAAHRRAGEELRERHDPGRLRDARRRRARSAAAKSRRTTRNSSASNCDFSIVEDPRRPAARAARSRDAARASKVSVRSTDSAASMGRPFSANLKLTDENKSSSTSARAGRRRERRAGRLHRPEAAGPLPEVRRPRLRRAAGYICEKAVGAEQARATSAPGG